MVLILSQMVVLLVPNVPYGVERWVWVGWFMFGFVVPNVPYGVERTERDATLGYIYSS